MNYEPFLEGFKQTFHRTTDDGKAFTIKMINIIKTISITITEYRLNTTI